MSQRLTQIRNEIDRLDVCYYNGGSRPVDDSIYDELKLELKHLAPDDERRARVGAPVSTDGILRKAPHVHPMGSLDNVMNEEEFLAWHELIKDAYGVEPLYNVTFKMDGGSVALIYKDGYMVQAITRGDGQEGEDITANALRMKGVPRYVEETVIRADRSVGKSDAPLATSRPFTGSVRGEVMLYNEDWKALDPDQLSNPRNLGNGISRRKDGEDTERLTFVVFRAFDSDGYPLGRTENDMLSALPPMGFEVVKGWGNCTADYVVEFYGLMQGDVASGEIGFTRDTLPFEIDGLVIKVEDLAFQTMVEDTSIRPKAQRALKFPPRREKTVINDIELTVGHTGAIIPTAVLEPVKIGGVIVTRASLCNFDEIDRLKIQPGETVWVSRQGDVIPKVIGRVHDIGIDPKPCQRPSKCPVCAGKVGYRKGVDGDDGVHLYCLNDDCSSKSLRKIINWCHKLDIQGLGEVFITELHGNGWIKTVADLYTLKNDTTPLEMVVGLARAPKILAEIEKKRELSLSDFLGCLGTDGLGRRRVKLVQQALPGEFDTLQDWLSGKLVEKAAEVGLPNLASEIQTRLAAVGPVINALLAAGVTIMKEETKAPEPKKEGQLTFVLTGKFDVKKDVYHQKISAAGHRFEENYRKGLSYLVTADPSVLSGKTKKAQKDGVPVISADEMLALL